MKTTVSRGGVAQMPRGRHEFSREAVAASQRRRLLDGVAEAVANRGYASATIGDVVAAAAVSRRTFYEQFPDIESCFLAAYQDGMERLLDRIRSAVRAMNEPAWQPRARVSIETYLGELAMRPAASWAFSVETLGAGRRVLEHRATVLSRWARQWRALAAVARTQDPGLAAVSDDDLMVLVGGIEECVRQCLQGPGAGSLPRLSDSLTAVATRTLGATR